MTEQEYYQLWVDNTRAYLDMLERRGNIGTPEYRREMVKHLQWCARMDNYE